MRNGYFPLGKNTAEGQKLVAAKNLITQVIASYKDLIFEESEQIYDAALDGGSIKILKLVTELIESELG